MAFSWVAWRFEQTQCIEPDASAYLSPRHGGIASYFLHSHWENQERSKAHCTYTRIITCIKTNEIRTTLHYLWARNRICPNKFDLTHIEAIFWRIYIVCRTVTGDIWTNYSNEHVIIWLHESVAPRDHPPRAACGSGSCSWRCGHDCWTGSGSMHRYEICTWSHNFDAAFRAEIQGLNKCGTLIDKRQSHSSSLCRNCFLINNQTRIQKKETYEPGSWRMLNKRTHLLDAQRGVRLRLRNRLGQGVRLLEQKDSYPLCISGRYEFHS